MFLPFNRNLHACVSKSIFSTDIVKVVRTLLEVDEPVDDSDCTFLMVEPRTESPSEIKLYACHISSGSSGIRAIVLSQVVGTCDITLIQLY